MLRKITGSKIDEWSNWAMCWVTKKFIIYTAESSPMDWHLPTCLQRIQLVIQPIVSQAPSLIPLKTSSKYPRYVRCSNTIFTRRQCQLLYTNTCTF
jgi:hypothetical protein